MRDRERQRAAALISDAVSEGWCTNLPGNFFFSRSKIQYSDGICLNWKPIEYEEEIFFSPKISYFAIFILILGDGLLFLGKIQP